VAIDRVALSRRQRRGEVLLIAYPLSVRIRSMACAYMTASREVNIRPGWDESSPKDCDGHRPGATGDTESVTPDIDQDRL
jgi:hypothetical protein